MGFVRFTSVSMALIAALMVSALNSFAESKGETPTAPTAVTQSVTNSGDLGGGRVNGALVAAPTQRAPSSVQDPSKPAWADQSQYVECGPSCMYKKANENLSLQALYAVKKMDNLQKIFAKGGPEDYGAVVKELRPYYCPDVSNNSQEESDAALCLRRYVQVQLPQLRVMRASIVTNEDSAARLLSDQTIPGKVSTIAELGNDKSLGKKPQTPTFTSEDELLTSAEGQKHLQLLADENYQAWAKHVFENRPTSDQFMKTETVLSDPKNPNSEKLNRVLRDKNGVGIVDQQAFSVAQQQYDALIKGLDPGKAVATNKVPLVPGSKTSAPTAPDATDGTEKIKSLFDVHGNYVKKDTGINQHLSAAEKLKEDQARLLAFQKKPSGTAVAPPVSDLESVSYNEARNAAVEVTTQLLGKQGVLGEVSYQPNPRNVASTLGTGTSSKQAPGTNGQKVESKSQSAQVEDPRQNDLGVGQVLKPVTPLVQKEVAPNKTVNGTYTVTFSPDAIQKSIDGFETFAAQQ